MTLPGGESAGTAAPKKAVAPARKTAPCQEGACPQVKVELFDFELPAERIALRPAAPRDSARLLVLDGDATTRDRIVRDLPAELRLATAWSSTTRG